MVRRAKNPKLGVLSKKSLFRIFLKQFQSEEKISQENENAVSWHFFKRTSVNSNNNINKNNDNDINNDNTLNNSSNF